MSYRPPAERWDRARLGYERDRYQDRDARGPYAPRDASVDDVYSRHARSHYDGDRHESRRYDEVERDRVAFRPARDRGFTIEKEREREYYAAEPPRPGLLRRQSSLDTFDRRPLKFLDRDREHEEEYGPPARYYGPSRGEDFRPGPPPLTPVRRALMPAAPDRHYDRGGYYEDEFPQQIREREREIIRRRRHSKESKHSRRSHSKESRSTHSTRSSSSSSSSASGTTISIKSEFPKKGKTRMPARLVSTKAIIDLGYPFEADVSAASSSNANLTRIGRCDNHPAGTGSGEYRRSHQVERGLLQG